MKIRPAVEADVPALVSLLQRSWLTIWAPELKFATVQTFAQTDPARHYAEDMWQQFSVADDDGTIVGMFHVEGDTLNAIHLDHRRKRQKIGSILMDEIERRISAEHPTARLEARAFNLGAIEFYKQRGWTENKRYQSTECGELVETIEMIKRFGA
jgi:ribosomal protein S18 acetylase RimI-like enzyme